MDDTRIAVLLTVRLKGLAAPHEVAQQTNLPFRTVRDVFVESVESGHVISRRGERSGYQLTERGRAWVESNLADELHRSGHTQHVEELYGEFIQLNRRFLTVCTDWQLRAGSAAPILNDHSDADYDASVLSRLRSEHRVAVDLSDRLARYLDRLGSYGPRLETAIRRVESGDMAWLLAPMIDSYHTVWMEWHQDLLCTLGRRRSDTA